MKSIKLIVAITGASGAIYGIRLLNEARKSGAETHLIVSQWAEATIKYETDYDVAAVKSLADYSYDEDDLSAALSSGSFRCDGMIVAPCSMKTLSAIAHGYTENLIVRAADVAIKERRRLVLMVRETPLSSIHLENMLRLSNLGVTIMPPVPALYAKPESVDDIIIQSVGRVLDQFGLEVGSLTRWTGD